MDLTQNDSQIRMMGAVPSDLCPLDSKLRLCRVLLHEATRLGFREKAKVAEHGFGRSAPQLVT